MFDYPALKTTIYSNPNGDEPIVFKRTDRFKPKEKIYIHSQINCKIINSHFDKNRQRIKHFVDPVFGVKIHYVASSFIKFSVFGSANGLSTQPVYKLNMGDRLNFELPTENLKFELSLTRNAGSILRFLHLEH